MEARAIAKYTRIAPRKVRLVVDLIRGKETEDAVNILRFTTKVASKTVLKVLNSAVANAQQKGARGDALVVSEVYVDEGPTLKRFRPRAMGRASRIRKRTSHITVVVTETEVTTTPKKRAAAEKIPETKTSTETKPKSSILKRRKAGSSVKASKAKILAKPKSTPEPKQKTNRVTTKRAPKKEA